MKIRAILESSKKERSVVVLSLGSLGRSPEVAKQANEQGFYVHMFCHEFPTPEARYAHQWTRIDCRYDFDSALSVARIVDPLAILLESKNMLLPMQNYLAKELGLTAVGDDAAETSNSKMKLRQCLERDKVLSLPWGLYEDIDDNQVTFPIVIKPDMGTASKGVRFVENRDQLKLNKDVFFQTKEDESVGYRWIYESYIKGRQFDLEGIASNGSYHTLTIVEEYYEASPPHFPPAWFYFNPPISDNEKELLTSATYRALASLSVQYGSWHMEQRIGVDGQVYIIDYANRMGYNQLVSSASGVSFSGEYIKTIVNRQYSMPELTRISQLQLFAFTTDTLKSMKLLVKSKPEHIHSKSFFPYEFSFHLYLGYVVIQAENHSELLKILIEFDLVPEQFKKYY